MNELIREYKETKRETINILNSIERKIVDLRREIGQDDKLLHQYEEDRKIVKSWLSNLNYSIQWLSLGHKPGHLRGIERRAAYEREIPFEPYWIQLQKDTSDYTEYTSLNGENNEIALSTQEQKEQTVSALMESLTDRQKEVLELVSNGFSLDEVAKLLNVHKGTVSQTLNKAKEKIREEGWFIP